MDYRTNKKTGEEISLLGFGCMRLPCLDEEQKRIDEGAAQAMVDRAVAAGVDYFDTAYMYHGGASEAFIGRALKKHPRQSWRLATKLPCWKLSGPGHVEHIFQKQLDNCGVDYFDYYLAHALDVETFEIFEKAGAYEFLTRKKEQGAIRQLGFSFHDELPVLERILDAHDWDFVQIQLNYVDWNMLDAKGMYELLETRGIPVVVMEPVRGGMLAAPGEGAEAQLAELGLSGGNAAQALRFAALPGVLTVLSGMNNMAQLEENIAVFSPLHALSDGERAALARLGKELVDAGNVPCTACRYCMDCPQGVDIPEVIRTYNYCLADGQRVRGDWNYGNMDAGKKADNCTDCGACAQKCPQHIDIPRVMKEIAGV